MKEIINKKILKEASVLLIAVIMILSTVAVTANTNDNWAVSLTSCTKGSNHMIFGNERILGNGGTLLWDNGDPDARDGLSCCYWSSYPIDREVVDDFDIDEISWVGGGHFRMVTYYGNTAEFIDGVNVFFYEDIGNEPSVNRYAERVAEFDAYNTGDYYFDRPEIAINVSFDTIELATGKWWVCFQPVLEDNGFWLTATGYGENVWGSDGGYPKWTKGHIIYGDYYDVSFKLFRSSPPPEKPQRPDGPTEGVRGVEYMFSTRTTDPEGEQVYYLWDWDDGTPTEWTDPYDSGVTVYANHIWTEIGEYNITVKAKDLDGGESEWSDPKTIYIVDAPILEIDTITGTLFKIKTAIKNIGDIDATRVNWSITLAGGVILSGRETSGKIVCIPAGDEKTISSGLIFGVGRVEITVTAEPYYGFGDEKHADGFVIGPFVFIYDGETLNIPGVYSGSYENFVNLLEEHQDVIWNNILEVDENHEGEYTMEDLIWFLLAVLPDDFFNQGNMQSSQNHQSIRRVVSSTRTLGINHVSTEIEMSRKPINTGGKILMYPRIQKNRGHSSYCSS